MILSALLDAGLLVAAAATVSGAGLVLARAAALWPAPAPAGGTKRSRLEEIMPTHQAFEAHETRVHADPTLGARRAFAAHGRLLDPESSLIRGTRLAANKRRAGRAAS